MLWIFLVFLGFLLVLFVKDQLTYGNSERKNKPLPLKGILVSGVLFYLISKGLINEEEEEMLETKSLKELEDYLVDHNIVTKQEWVDLCLNECNTVAIEDIPKDMTIF